MNKFLPKPNRVHHRRRVPDRIVVSAAVRAGRGRRVRRRALSAAPHRRAQRVRLARVAPAQVVVQRGRSRAAGGRVRRASTTPVRAGRAAPRGAPTRAGIPLEGSKVLSDIVPEQQEHRP